MSSDCNSPPCDDANGSIYIETLDRSDFFVAFLKFGIPCIICWFIGGWAFRKAQFKIKLLPSVISALTFRNWLSDDKTLEKSVGWLSLFITVVALLPSLFILLWGIYVYKNINKLLGFALFLLLMSFQMVTYGFAHWRVNGWRKDRLIIVLFTAALLAMWAFEIWTIYLEQPFKYFMLSVVYVSFNMIPMTILTYMVAQSMTKPVEGYLLLSNDPVQEYKKYLKETLDAQRVKIENLDKPPIGPCGPVVQPTASSSSSVGLASGTSVKFHLNSDAAPQNADAPVSEQKIDVVQQPADIPPVNNSDAMAVGVLDAEKYNPPLWKKLGMYLLAVAILLAYAISVNKAKQADGFGNVVGWITSGTILALDLTVWLCVFGGKITSPLIACLYQGAGRIILVVFGDVYWFIGHSMMYVFLAVFFGSAMVNHLAPKLNATQQKSSIVSDLLAPSANPGSETSTTEVAAMRNSDELGAGFMREGRFAQSRLGKSIINNVEFYAFGLLTFFFLIDLIVCSKTSTVPLALNQNQDQYLAGILALFLTFVCLSSQLVYRMYYNRDFRIDADMVLGCVIQWLMCVGCGVFLYTQTRSAILICFFCFLPPIVYLATFAYTEWVKNDFQLYVDGKPVAPGAGGRRRVDRAPADQAHFIPANAAGGQVDEVVLVQPAPTPSPNSADPTPSPVDPGQATPAAAPMRMPNVREINVDLGKYNSWKKYKIAVTALMSMILVIGMGSTIAAHSNPPYVGYSIAAVMLILACTIIPMIEWFNSFEVSKNMITQLIFTTVFFIAFILIFWIQGLNKENNNKSLALLFVLFMYPTLVTLAFALLKWRDDKWVMSRFVKLALIACCVLITTFFIVVAVVYEPYQIGAGLLVCFMVLLFGSFIVPILVKRFPWLIKWSIIGGICVLIAFAAGVGSQKNTGFIGFSLGWGILFLVLLVSTYQLHRNTSPSALFSHMYSPNLFPVFAYDFTPGVQNPLRPDNKRVYFVLLTIFTAVVWGALAVFFLQTTWIGLGVHAISIVLLVIYGYECSTQSRVMLAKAVRYLGEGSEQYEKAVHSAKLAAFRSQLVSIKGVNLTADGVSAQVAPVSPRDGKSGGDQQEEAKSPSDHTAISMPSPSSVNSLADDAYDESLYLEEKDLKDLGLDSPDSRLTEIDYQSLYKLFNELRAVTPLPSFSAFLKGDKAEVAKITWHNNTLVRRRCYELLLKLDRQIATQYSNFLAYSTQVQMELILAVNAIKRDHETEILTMLRDTGHAHLDINYVQSLKPNDPERIALEAALKDWKAKQDLIVIERARKRKEEEERARIREEEDRKRYLEEQEIIIRKRQEEMKVNEEDVRRKEEERKRLEQEALLQHQLDEQLRAEAARLEAERFAREKAEAERKKLEEAEAARLIAEQNERQLQVLRAQQEAARIAEEKRKEEERLTMERLKAEQAARDAALAAERQAQAALQAKIQAAYQKKCCTFNETGEKFVPQQWYQCENCNMGICEICRSVCHSGHKLKDMGSSAFYCDCGKTGCEAATGIKPGMKGKPTLAQIEAQFAVTGVPWTDPDFPPSKKSLFRDGVGAKKTEWKDLQWKRPEEVRNFKDPKMFVNGADPLDINQGQIGDCWFMSAISVMTQRQQDFMNIFVTKEHSKAGVYSVNFYKNGERVNVLIDSNFPVSKNNSLAFGHSRESDELWVSVLEKAFAKLNNSYESIEAGFVDQALVDLSGGIGLRIDFTKDPYKQQIKSGVLFNQLLQFHENGYLLGAGSPAGSDSEANASASGIVQGHAYAILQVAEVDGIQLLRLRNPWGRKEWTGDYSDDSAKWTRRLKSKLNWVSADDGAFWMCMADFVRNFEEAYVARFFSPDKGWECLPVIRGEWKGANAGGCTNYDTVKDNPQYLLTVTQPTTVLLNLSQADTRGTGEKLKPIAIEVYNNKGVRITRTRTGPLICSNPESYIFRREICVEQVLQPQKEPYTILLSTFNQGEETKFSFTVYANAKVTIAEAPAVVAKKK